MEKHVLERIQRRSANVFTIFVDMETKILEAALQYLANMTGDERPAITWGTSLLTNDGKILLVTALVFPDIPLEHFPIHTLERERELRAKR